MTSNANPVNDLKTAQQNGSLAGKYLSFFLGDEEYGLEILKVVEIIGIMNITPVPKTPDFIKGIINLRGKVTPVMDLRLKFGMEAKARTNETVIIIVQAIGIEMGIIVDKVSEVLDIPAEQIENSPSFGVEVNTDYILGIGKTEGNVKILLDIDRVLSEKDIIEMANAREEGENLLH
jgi:purine-binding chemotaxis protein CheW